MRKSLVPGKFPGNLIEKYIVPIFEAPIVEPQKSPDSASFNKIKMKKKAGYKEGKKSKSKLGDYLHPNSQIERMKEEENKKRTIQTEKLIFKISEALFKHGLTITKWLNKGIKENPKTLIRDRVIDGHEYQLIKRDNFIDALEEIGIHTTLRDKDNLKQLLGTTFLDFINLKIVINIFSKLGINEDIPNSTKMLNFEIFNGECIRIYNRIIQ